jgi:molybdopterin-guanine dinucleotide biosynthesis protein A
MISGAVLAGGTGSRIGGAKPSRLLGGRTLAQWALDGVQRAAPMVMFAVAPDETPPDLDARVPVIVCEDLLPGRGPLAGIYTALRCSGADAVVVVPCDAPFVEPALLELLLAQRQGWDAVVPEAGGRLQTAFGVYTGRCLPALIEALNGGDLSVHALLSRLRVRVVPEADVRAVDPELRSFFNVNTEADLCRAESMIAALAAR